MARVRAVVGLVAVLALGRAAVAEPDKSPIDVLVRALDRARSAGGDPAAAQEVATLVGTLARTSEGVAARIESGRFEV